MKSVVESVICPDGLRQLVIYVDGDLYSFVEDEWVTEERGNTGEMCSYWSPVRESGLYSPLEDARADAAEAVKWLRTL